ncbi:substrate-binding periplasmic protein [Salidesulfovibrio brasiliensis]|uniref:substrate-binding periplasmic protein n=1 Tax=Salidesulfovibrio brasiliensis TaxID=221711 RepID=UPI0006D1F4CF|nr:transporter substrate-binding domain-containing protein [Salidesulfovibrio brasiliensis]
MILLVIGFVPSTAMADANGSDGPVAEPIVYRMGADTWPPYEFVQDGEAFGIASEITLAVFKSMNKDVSRVYSVPWKRGLNMLTHGELDLLVSGVRTAKREAVYHYPDEPLMHASWRIFVPKGSTINALEDLKGQTVGLVLGYQYPQKVLDRVRQIANVQYVSDNETNIRKLANGRLDALLADYLNGLWIIDSLSLTGTVVPAAEALGERALYTLFSRETVSAETVKAFSEALILFKKTPEYREMIARYHP